MRMIGRKWKVSERSAENGVSLLCELVPPSVLEKRETEVSECFCVDQS